MSDAIKELYKEIKEKLTAEHLKKITVDIIDSYKNKDNKRLNQYGSVLNINSEKNITKLFSLLIKQYHPDKFTFIRKQAEELYGNNDLDALQRFHGGYFFNIERAGGVPDSDGDVEFEAEYVFDEDDFGYREKNIFEEDNFGETGLDYEEETHGFMEALNKFIFGGLDETVTVFDLNKIDGALDLSDYDINDLSGIEHCIYLHEVNLSNNSIEKIGKLSALINLKSLFLSNNLIENIEALKNLADLKEIDISFNNVTDISVLEDLHELEYVNIIGNPITDYSTINTLVKKGVIVIFD